MVARGDLGLEVPFAQVPRVQKEMLRGGAGPRRAGDRRHAGARVDARGAAADARRGQRRGERRRLGASAIMLAGETAVGEFPVRAVQALDAIVRDAEADGVHAPGPVPRRPRAARGSTRPPWPTPPWRWPRAPTPGRSSR